MAPPSVSAALILWQMKQLLSRASCIPVTAPVVGGVWVPGAVVVGGWVTGGAVVVAVGGLVVGGAVVVAVGGLVVGGAAVGVVVFLLHAASIDKTKRKLTRIKPYLFILLPFLL